MLAFGRFSAFAATQKPDAQDLGCSSTIEPFSLDLALPLHDLELCMQAAQYFPHRDRLVEPLSAAQYQSDQTHLGQNLIQEYFSLQQPEFPHQLQTPAG
jgi:hypothetical protein